MDILLAKATQFLSGLFLPLFLGVAAALAAYVVLSRRGMLNDVRRRRLQLIMGLTVLTYVLSFFCAELLLDRYANLRLETLADENQGTLVIHGKGRMVRIQDSNVIQELLSVIGKAKRVGAHHSHPVNELLLELPEVGYTYSLGPDSEAKDEYWLKWVSHPLSSPGVDSITVVRQFQSKQLSEWLRRYLPWDTVPP